MNTATALPFAEQPAPGKAASILLAVTVHVLLLAFLFYGIRWQTQHPAAIEVELVVAAPEPIPQVETPPPPAEPVPETKPEPIAKVEPPPPPPKPEIAVKEKQKPKPIRPAPVPPKPKYDPSKKWLEEEIKQVTERKNTDAAALELANMKAARESAALSKTQKAWQDKIAAKIKGNIIRPANITGNPEAIFEVVLLPDGGLVGEPKIRKSTGTPALDAAIERAIRKSDPLPKPIDPSVFQRVLLLTFRPLEDQ